VAVLTLKRVRLELDRALRSRAFFSRATRGLLEPLELLDLETQLGTLLERAGGELAADSLRLIQQDRTALQRADSLPFQEPGPAPVLLVIHSLLRENWTEAFSPPELTYWVSVALTGTSWSRDAALALDERLGGGAEFLYALSRLGPHAARVLERGLEGSSLRCEQVHAAVELARGVVLGLAAHLDEAWPVRVALMTLRSPQSLHGEDHK